VADEAAEPLLKREDRERDLVLAKGRPALGVDRLDTRRGDRIAW